MFRRIDRSSILAKWIEHLSTFLAKRRGLPAVVGIVLVIVGFVMQLIDVYAMSQTLRLFAVIFQNVGILVGLIGLLLSEALGN